MSNSETRVYLHARLDALQFELTECRSTRQLRVLEGAIFMTRAWLTAVSS